LRIFLLAALPASTERHRGRGRRFASRLFLHSPVDRFPSPPEPGLCLWERPAPSCRARSCQEATHTFNSWSEFTRNVTIRFPVSFFLPLA
jgi:hypothetical protein